MRAKYVFWIRPIEEYLHLHSTVNPLNMAHLFLRGGAGEILLDTYALHKVMGVHTNKSVDGGEQRQTLHIVRTVIQCVTVPVLPCRSLKNTQYF